MHPSMHCHLRLFLLLVTGIVATYRTPAVAEEMKPQPKPALIAKGKDFFVHAVSDARCMLVLHTNRSSGEMKRLMSVPAEDIPVGRLGSRSGRTTIVTSRIVGLLADAERLYVLRATGQHGWNRFSGVAEMPASSDFRLSAFRLADGSLVEEKSLAANELPPETTEAGPLRTVDGGVSAFGQTFVFGDKKQP